MAGEEGDAPAGHLAHRYAVGWGAVGRVDGHVAGAVEEAVEAGPSEQAELSAERPGHRRRQADFSAVFLVPSEEEPEEESEELDFAFSPDRSLFSPGLDLPEPEPARRLSVE